MVLSLKVGGPAPEFSWSDRNGNPVNLSDVRGKSVVLYFYPKDNTPGCTIEARGFASKYNEFLQKNALVVGVSRDSISSHEKFSNLCGLPFPLISDKDEKLCNAYGTLVEKSMMGKKYMGIDRSTFIISPEGKLDKIWRNVSVLGHVEEVLSSL